MKAALYLFIAMSALALAVGFWMTLQEDADEEKNLDNASKAHRASSNDLRGADQEDNGEESPSGVPEDVGNEEALSSESENEKEPTAPEKLEAKDIEALLIEHEAAFRRGSVETCRGLEAKLTTALPLARFEVFTTRLHRSQEFAYRTRLLELLGKDEDGALWLLFQKEFNRYGKAPGSHDWSEGELHFLTRLGERFAPHASKYERGLSMLEEILLGPRKSDFKLKIVGAINEVRKGEGALYLPLLRRVCEKGSELELKRVAAMLRLSFVADKGARRAILSAPETQAYKPWLIAHALRENLLPKDELILEAKAYFAGSNNIEGVGELYREFVTAAPEDALVIARELFSSKGLERSVHRQMLELMIERGSSQEQELIVEQACASGSAAKLALRALGDAGKIVRVGEVFERTKSASAKAVSLSYLAKTDQRDQWLEKGLRQDQAAAVRVASTSHLDISVSAERQKLKDLAQSDPLPAVRERALKSMGRVDEVSLIAFFQTVRDSDASPAIRSLASQYAERLERLKREKEKQPS